MAGIFDEQCNCFSGYLVTLEFIDKLCGGTPMDGKTIEGWLRTKMKLNNADETRRKVAEALADVGFDIDASLPDEALAEAIEKVAGEKHTNGFKHDENGLYIEGRQIEAAIKEEVNILFAHERWGPTKKGPKSFVAERVNIPTLRIYLGRREADGLHLFVGHVSGANGLQATLTRYQYVEKAEITFLMRVLRYRPKAGEDGEKAEKVGKDTVDPKEWPYIFSAMQANGLGALRSQGMGTFEVRRFEKLSDEETIRIADHGPEFHLPEGADPADQLGPAL